MVTPKGAKAAISVKTNQMTTVVKGQNAPTIEALSEKDKKQLVIPIQHTQKTNGHGADREHENRHRSSAVAQPVIKADSAKSSLPPSGVSLVVTTPSENQNLPSR